MEAIKSFRNKYEFLSNFYPCLIVYDNDTYASVERAFQAAKCEDRLERLQFQICPSDKEAKKRGRDVKLRPDWEDVKVDIMRDLLKYKFSQPHLLKLLIETGDAELIECNTWGDTFWGVCKGEGQNMLGELLMEIREEVKKCV